MAASDYGSQTDRELAIGAANGDRNAFAALYDRFFPGIYDFAVRSLRDADAAADVAENTFSEANRALSQRQIPDLPAAWLYGLARSYTVAASRQPPPTTPGSPLPALTEIDPARSAAPIAPDAETRELVWEAAAALGPAEYALLDASLRRHLPPDEIAAGFGISPETASTNVNNLRAALDRSLVTGVLIRRGGETCPELAALLARTTGGASSPAVQEAVQAHLQTCNTCQATVAGVPSAQQVFAAFALAPAPSGFKEIIWGNVAGAAVAAAAAPLPPAFEEEKGGRGWLWALLGGLAAIIAIAVILFLVFGGDDDDTEAAGNPEDIRSTSHEVDEPSTEPVIVMVWSRLDGAMGYSVDFTEEEFTQPPDSANLSSQATETSSDPLDAGEWWFHIRTQDADGEWSDAEHVGPFPIEAEETPEPTEEPTDEPTDEPTAEPTPEPTEEPTEEPTPVPTEEPTDAPTPGADVAPSP